MIRRPPRSTPLYSSAASDVYKTLQIVYCTFNPSTIRSISIKSLLINRNSILVCKHSSHYLLQFWVFVFVVSVSYIKPFITFLFTHLKLPIKDMRCRISVKCMTDRDFKIRIGIKCYSTEETSTPNLSNSIEQCNYSAYPK